MSRSNSARSHPTTNLKQFKPDPKSNSCLTFDADFECGNLGNAEKIGDNEYNLEIRQDTNNSKFRLWFYFSVTGYASKQTVLFHINNFSKNKSLYRNGQSPIVRLEDSEKWYRLPPDTCYYYKPKKEACYTLSFAFKFPDYTDEDTNKKDKKVFFAYCFPYSYTKLQNFLQKIETDPKNKDILERELLAASTNKKRVDLLTITSPSNFARITKEPEFVKSQVNKSKKLTESSYIPVVFISARVHPGETPASFIMQTIIEFLLSSAGRNLRKVAVFKLVPMINPDGVVSGNYRCNENGHDLNRCYQDPSAWQHPEVFGLKDEISKYLEEPVSKNLSSNQNNKLLKAELYIDIHGHSCLTNSFMYGNLFEQNLEKSLDQHILPNLMDKISPDFCIRNTSYNCDEIKKGSGRRTFEDINHLYAYTLEVSMSHFFGKFNTSAIFYDEPKYLKIGEYLMKSIEQYFVTRKKHGRKSIPANSMVLVN